MRGWNAEHRAEVLRNGILWLTIAVLVLAVLTFLLSVNAVISIWFRSQWAPVARAVASLAVIALCLYILVRVTRRSMAPQEAFSNESSG